ncbi:15-hydroxyprostaglandin dehydrogenase [Vitis vinifera]|uniref:15-hydroxyprostaglandin dehydrogenase n=1 Tax=Vitis vinifera TaxID=29760 RepID=A0A438EQ02_VITVI|nr:15-hydroxyprostaglandin dehydrogenase [Vitis vinifera]
MAFLSMCGYGAAHKGDMSKACFKNFSDEANDNVGISFISSPHRQISGVGMLLRECYIHCQSSSIQIVLVSFLNRELAAAFKKHLATYGGLDICVNSAGIGTHEPFHKDQTENSGLWRRTINVNLVAVIDCTRLAIQTMQAAKKPGVIINMGSASGLYPMYVDPIYSASKGGVVLFTRSLAPYKRHGIRVNVLALSLMGLDHPFLNNISSSLT